MRRRKKVPQHWIHRVSNPGPRGSKELGGVFSWYYPSIKRTATIYARQFLGARPPTQFRHRLAEMNHSNHYTDSNQARWLPNSFMPSAKLISANLPSLIAPAFDVTRSGIEPWPPAPRVNALTTMQRGRLHLLLAYIERQQDKNTRCYQYSHWTPCISGILTSSNV